MSKSNKKLPLPFDPETVDLDTMLKRLNLANTRRGWKGLVERAETERWSCRDFLVALVSEEIAQRQQTRLQRATRDAHFPFLKTIDEYDFSLQSSLRRQLLGSYLGPELVSEGRNLILMGKSGRGKTHLSVAIGYRAIQNGFTALFRTAASLIEELSVATTKGKLHDALWAYVQPNVLVVDEMGYLTYGSDAANVLFHVVNERHLRRRPMIFTTNKSPLTAWGDVLHDHDLAEAIVDRVLERGRLIVLDGPSYRTRHLESEGKSAHNQPAIVSGKHPPSFPEPTFAEAEPRRKHHEPKLLRPGRPDRLFVKRAPGLASREVATSIRVLFSRAAATNTKPHERGSQERSGSHEHPPTTLPFPRAPAGRARLAPNRRELPGLCTDVRRFLASVGLRNKVIVELLYGCCYYVNLCRISELT